MKISLCQTCQKEPLLIEETRSFVISCSGCGQSIWDDGSRAEAILHWNAIQKKLGPMTDDDLILVRFLFTVICEAESWATTARQRFDNVLLAEMGSLASRSKMILHLVCGRDFDQIGDKDLDATSPAPWTQLPYDKRSS